MKGYLKGESNEKLLINKSLLAIKTLVQWKPKKLIFRWYIKKIYEIYRLK
jgi:hypothetical protein